MQVRVRETALTEQRLHGELIRTVHQAKMFADPVEEGSLLEATIDHAQDTPLGPGPDLRRMLVPLGPVAVAGASNFPLAFAVPGGDTLAASVSAPDGLLGFVFELRAGIDLVTHRAIKAVGFTGSLAGGKALMDAIA